MTLDATGPAWKLYAETPGRRSAQLLGDLLALGLVVLAIRAGQIVRTRVGELAAPGWELEQAGTRVHDSLAATGAEISAVPGVGDARRQPLDAIAATGGSIATVGRAQQSLVGQLATPLAVLVVLVGLLLVARWLVARVRWARAAREARRMARSQAGIRLLALRALTSRPVDTVAAVHHDPVTAWREGDPEVTATLAGVELRALGLRVPRWLGEDAAQPAP